MCFAHIDYLVNFSSLVINKETFSSKYNTLCIIKFDIVTNNDKNEENLTKFINDYINYEFETLTN